MPRPCPGITPSKLGSQLLLARGQQGEGKPRQVPGDPVNRQQHQPELRLGQPPRSAAAATRLPTLFQPASSGEIASIDMASGFIENAPRHIAVDQRMQGAGQAAADAEPAGEGMEHASGKGLPAALGSKFRSSQKPTTAARAAVVSPASCSGVTQLTCMHSAGWTSSAPSSAWYCSMPPVANMAMLISRPMIASAVATQHQVLAVAEARCAPSKSPWLSRC